ncbi:MAG: NIL domain-containing protein [Candidatus Omnitrophota bacterium]
MQMAIGLTFPGKLQDESVICSLCKKFAINLNIIEASFSMSSGWAFLEIEGDKEEIKKAFEYLSSKSIKIQPIKRSK